MNKLLKKVADTVDKKNSNVELSERETIEREFYTKALLMILSAVFMACVVFAVVFFLNLRGKEETKVPDITGMDLPKALITLQEKELYPKLTVRFSNPNDKGLVIEQEPSAGAVVKAGRRIAITVSSGGVVNKVGEYVGKNLDMVKIDLKKLFSTSTPLLVVSDSVIYEFSDEQVGTILKQHPPAGTEISGVTNLDFVVSRGPAGTTYEVPIFETLSFQDALKKVTHFSLPFNVTARPKRKGELAGVIVAQQPEIHTQVPYKTVVQMEMTIPDNISSTASFGIMTHVIQEYNVSVTMKLEKITASGEKSVVFNTRTWGGALTIPYLEEVGTELVLYINGEETKRYQVRKQ